jgi:hypothetical protein
MYAILLLVMLLQSASARVVMLMAVVAAVYAAVYATVCAAVYVMVRALYVVVYWGPTPTETRAKRRVRISYVFRVTGPPPLRRADFIETTGRRSPPFRFPNRLGDILLRVPPALPCSGWR